MDSSSSSNARWGSHADPILSSSIWTLYECVSCGLIWWSKFVGKARGASCFNTRSLGVRLLWVPASQYEVQLMDVRLRHKKNWKWKARTVVAPLHLPCTPLTQNWVFGIVKLHNFISSPVRSPKNIIHEWVSEHSALWKSNYRQCITIEISLLPYWFINYRLVVWNLEKNQYFIAYPCRPVDLQTPPLTESLDTGPKERLSCTIGRTYFHQP